MAAPRNENVKELILSAAGRLLENRMLSDISLAEIAKEAGISKGTLYYHYKTKDDILFDIADEYLTTQWNDFIKWTENPEKDTSLNRLAAYVMQRNADTPKIKIHLLAEAMTGSEQVRTKLIKRYRDFTGLISQKIAQRTEGIPSEYASMLLLLAGDGLFIQKQLGNPDFDEDSFLRTTSETIKLIAENLDKTK